MADSHRRERCANVMCPAVCPVAHAMVECVSRHRRFRVCLNGARMVRGVECVRVSAELSVEYWFLNWI